MKIVALIISLGVSLPVCFWMLAHGYGMLAAGVVSFCIGVAGRKIYHGLGGT